MKAIKVENLQFAYEADQLVIDDVSFNIEQGTYTTIIGHNGSGKSTIAKIIMGLLERKSGEIEVNGLPLDIQHIDEIRRNVGIVFQNPDNQFIGATVRDDIAFGLENRCVPKEEMDEIIYKYAKLVNMEDYLDSEPQKLSGGQKQRVAIAGILAMKPNIIIFDEASSMLDPQGKKEIMEVITNLHQQQKMTIISITHDIEEVAYSDYVIVLDQGKKVLEGKPEDVLTKDKQLVAMQLDIPFSLKMTKLLQGKNIKLKNAITMEGLVEEICQYNLNN